MDEQTGMIRCGTATVDVTPPTGSMMAAFPRGPERIARRAKGAHDPLQAKVLVLEPGGEAPLALCTLDACMIRPIDLNRIRSRVGKQIPALNGPRLIVGCSHTHAGAETSYLFGNTPDDPWVAETDRRIADAVLDAYRQLRPVTVAHACVPLDITHNRRVLDDDGRSRMVVEHENDVTTGPVDPDLDVLRFDAVDVAHEDGPAVPVAILYHYTAHALTLGPKNDFFSADYPGRASGIIEHAYPDSTAFFFNGAAGNVHPRECMRPDPEATEAIGNKLGKAVVDTADWSTRIAAQPVRFAADVLTFPNRVDSTLQVEVELSCLRLGDIVFVFVPGEVFVEFQLELKRQLRDRTILFVGYANGWPGYVPTEAAYPQGGYGVDLNTSDPPQYSRTALPPGAGETILETLIELADRTADKAEHNSKAP